MLLRAVVTTLLAVRAFAQAPCSDLEARRPACPHPEYFLSRIVETVNAHRHEPISKILPHLGFGKGTIVGANHSHSLQFSDFADNPRLYLLTECGPLTFTLYAKSLEIAIVKQVAEAPIANEGPVSKNHGEILVDFKQFPRETPYTVPDVVNRLSARYAQAPPNSTSDQRERSIDGSLTVSHDTHVCSSCHVDSGYASATQTSLGQIRWSNLDAIVSPYERTPGHQPESLPVYSLNELRKLYECRCTENPPAAAECRAFQEKGEWPKRSAAQRTEGCARLRFVLELEPTPHCDFTK